jgi:hypothetical protein
LINYRAAIAKNRAYIRDILGALID